jgi:hypothetical protein
VNNVHTAFNGPGGIVARPTPQEEAYGREQHTAALASQTEHEHAASQNRALFASENHGRPAIAATDRPGQFSGRGVVAAREAGGDYHAPKMSPSEARASGGERGAREETRNEPDRNAEHNNNVERNNDRAMNRPANQEAKNEARNNEGRNNQARQNAKQNHQEKQNQKKAQKQQKAEQKRNDKEQR